MTATIKITAEFAADLTDEVTWFIINEDYIVGGYRSRTEAREHKAGENLVGKIVKRSDITLEVIKPVAPIGGENLNRDPHEYCCPHCGVDLANGVGQHGDEVNGKAVKHEAYEYECLACGGEFGAPIKAKAAKPAAKGTHEVTHTSTIERPCKQVWHIADRMVAANPKVRRSEVLAACVSEGIAYYTARTQYQQWLGIRKEMAERESSQAAAKK